MATVPLLCFSPGHVLPLSWALPSTIPSKKKVFLFHTSLQLNVSHIIVSHQTLQTHKLAGGRDSHGLEAATEDCRDILVSLCPRDHLDTPLSSPPGPSAPSASCPRHSTTPGLSPCLFTCGCNKETPQGLGFSRARQKGAAVIAV